jgi:hypothetical protein
LIASENIKYGKKECVEKFKKKHFDNILV